MTLLSTTAESDDLGRGRHRLTQHLRPIAYRDEGGVLRPIANDWQDSGITERPHIITAAPLMVSVAPDGMRRLHPTRELDRYAEFGAPFIKIGGVWQKAPLGSPDRSAGRLQWTTANANMYVDFAGHYVKLAILLKGGFVPEDGQFAFPVGLSGLTRQGSNLLADGVPVMHLRRPVVYDFDNEEDTRPIAHEFVRLGGQDYVLFTLPDLTGMARPLVDPTLTLQPDATAGLDTWVVESPADSNNGTDANLWVRGAAGVRRNSFIKFDVSSIAGATVDSATLSLWNAETRPSGQVVVFHSILAANSAWTEGGATWDYAVASTTRWAGDSGADGGTDAGCSVSGTDYNATQLGSFSYVGGTAIDTEWPATLNTAQVQAWVDGSNYGLIAVSSGILSMHSSDAATAGLRPKLVIEYTAPAAAGWGPRLAMQRNRRVRP